MAKKQLYFEEAERLYVIEQMTISEIARRLSLGEKTVWLWKEEGRWEEKKQQFISSKQGFHEELYEFSRLLMKNVREDMEAGKQVDAGRLYTLGKMIPLITKIKAYEDVVAQKEKAGETQKGLTEDVVKAIEKEVLGIE